MTGSNNILLKLKTLFVDGASAGFSRFTGALRKQVNGARSLVSGLAAGLGEVQGAAGKALDGASRLLSGFLSLGPVGAAISGVALAIETVGNKFKAAADKTLEATRAMADGIKSKFSEIKSAALESLAETAAKATANSDAATKSFNNLASAVSKVAAANDNLQKARDLSAIAAMAEEKERAVSAAATPAESARVAADYDVKIAEARAEATRKTNEAEREAASRELADAETRLSLARAALREASEARRKAAKEAEAYRDSPDKDLEKASAKALADAERKVIDARLALTTAQADFNAAQSNVGKTSASASASGSDAKAAVERAARARRDLAKAQAEEEEKAAQAVAKERERLDREEAARRERERQKELSARIRDLQTLNAEERAAQAELSAAQAKTRQAWNWYRDKDSLAAQLKEEKDDAAAQRQFEKDFERLKFRSDWREAKNLSLDDEAVRRVALAKEEERKAEEYVRQTAENSQRAADALETLEKIMSEGGTE